MAVWTIFFEKIYFHIAGCPTPNALLRMAVCHSECHTPYKCALLRKDTIWSPTRHKNPTSVGAKQIIQTKGFS